MLFVATLFGQLWRLEPLPPEKKSMWRREMEWLLCVSDHIVELIPSWQTFPDGSKLEVIPTVVPSLIHKHVEILEVFVHLKYSSLWAVKGFLLLFFYCNFGTYYSIVEKTAIQPKSSCSIPFLLNSLV